MPKPIRRMKEGTLVKGYEEKYDELIERPLKIVNGKAVIYSEELKDLVLNFEEMLLLGTGTLQVLTSDMINNVTVNTISISDGDKMVDSNMDTFGTIEPDGTNCETILPVTRICQGEIEFELKNPVQVNNLILKFEPYNVDPGVTLNMIVEAVYEDGTSTYKEVDNSMKYVNLILDVTKKVTTIRIRMIKITLINPGVGTAGKYAIYGLFFINSAQEVLVINESGVPYDLPEKGDIQDVIDSVNNNGSNILDAIHNNTSTLYESLDSIYSEIYRFTPKYSDYIPLIVQGNLTSGNYYTATYTVPVNATIVIEDLYLSSYEGNGYAQIEVNGDVIAYTSVSAGGGFSSGITLNGYEKVDMKYHSITGDDVIIKLVVYADSSDYFFARVNIKVVIT